MTKSIFPLAPMSPLILGLTLIVLAMPLLLWTAGLNAVAIGVGMLYAAVWLFGRPTRFEVGPTGLDVVFPLRSFHVSRTRLAGATRLNKEAFKRRFGWGARIGAGGLWGGFGWLWTQKEGLVDMYISRVDEYVVVDCLDGRPLLLSPSDPTRFVEAVRGLLPSDSP